MNTLMTSPVLEQIKFDNGSSVVTDFELPIKDFGDATFRVTKRMGSVNTVFGNQASQEIVIFELRMVTIYGGSRDGNGNDEMASSENVEMFNYELIGQKLKDHFWNNKEDLQTAPGYDKVYDKFGVVMMGDKRIGDSFYIGA